MISMEISGVKEFDEALATIDREMQNDSAHTEKVGGFLKDTLETRTKRKGTSPYVRGKEWKPLSVATWVIADFRGKTVSDTPLIGLSRLVQSTNGQGFAESGWTSKVAAYNHNAFSQKINAGMRGLFFAAGVPIGKRKRVLTHPGRPLVNKMTSEGLLAISKIYMESMLQAVDDVNIV